MEDKMINLDKIFNRADKIEIQILEQIISEIDKIEPEIKALDDEQLKNKTKEFKERLANGETLDDILIEAFAVAREASYRVLGMRQYTVQLMGGIVLHQGRIAEMKTGEGKTLVGVAPVYLNALSGDGVHVVTVNDYLAKRDKELMEPIYNFLGLSVGVILHGQNSQERKEQYECDITYGTNNEFGFDYLKDNMVTKKEDKVQRVLNYAIVDEIDSILIDEARTPLIISGKMTQEQDEFRLANVFIKILLPWDFTVDEKEKTVALTEEGIKQAEMFFKVENLMDIENIQLYHRINQALKAFYTMKRDVDYSGVRPTDMGGPEREPPLRGGQRAGSARGLQCLLHPRRVGLAANHRAALADGAAHQRTGEAEHVRLWRWRRRGRVVQAARRGACEGVYEPREGEVNPQRHFSHIVEVKCFNIIRIWVEEQEAVPEWVQGHAVAA